MAVFQHIASRHLPWVLAALASLIALLGVFTLPVLDRDEARFAQASAQMMESGDFIRISFLDTARHKKPVGIHWAQVLSVKALSSPEARQIWAYRLPSVAGLILMVLSAFYLGAPWLGRHASAIGASLLAVSVLAGAEGGIAKTDALMVGFTTLALLGLTRVYLHADAPQKARIWAIVTWGALGAGALIKGPVTPLIVILSGLALLGSTRQWRWLIPFFYWPGPVLGLAIILPWLISIQIATQGGFLREALGQDLGPKVVSGHEGHGGWPGTHSLLLILLFFPATLALPAGFYRLWRAIKDQNEAFKAALILISVSVPGLVVFEFLPTKLAHYALPAYPGLALIAGWGLAHWRETPIWVKAIGTVLFILGAGLFLTALIVGQNQFSGDWVWTGLAFALLTLTSLVCLFSALHPKARFIVLAALVTGLSWHIAFRTLAVPHLHDLDLSRQADQALNDMCNAEGRTIVSSYSEPSFAFLRHGQVIFADNANLLSAAPDETVVFVVDHSRDGGDAIEMQLGPSCGEGVGFNYSRGDITRLTLHPYPQR
ncbi:ArnT family glycosyltransferase [Woodsholea maritima]|uniref:ArnT family glycosyltransferase n=1 Tax=Woodsholea maritima TaxID=240237 RepID=UPI00035D3C20|nr:glycosyltransferase family 39 protein [Woodsholea maritima]